MASPSTSGDGENVDADVDGISATAQPDLAPREGQLLQGITNLQQQLDTMSQRQDELMGLIGVLREQQEGPISGPLNGVRARTVSPRGSVSYERPGSVSSAGREPPTSRSSPERSRSVPPNHSQQPPPHRDPATFADPNVPPPQQNAENGGPVPGHPDPQQTPPQGQGQVPGQPPFHDLDQNNQIFNPPPNSFPPRLVPIFEQIRDQTGQTIGLIHRSSVTLSRTASGDTDPGARQLPLGLPRPTVHQPLTYLPVRPQGYPQVPLQTNPQMPPRMHPQIPPQMQTRGLMSMNWNGPAGPPPPYPGPGSTSVVPMPGTNQAGPSTNRRRARNSLRPDPDDGPEDEDTGLDARPALRRRTRTNPTRKARPTKLSESD